MELFFTPVHVFWATVAGFIMGAVWYSSFLFKNVWLQGEGVLQGQMPKRTKMYLFQVNVYSFIAHCALASVLAILYDILGVKSLSLAIIVGLLLTFGFIVTTRFIDMVYTPHGKHYEMQSQIKFLVNSGYYLTVISVMSAVLFLLSH